MNNLYKKSIFVWLLFIPIAILNGIIREFTYKQVVGDNLAHIISTITAVSAFIALSYFMLRKSITEVENKKLFLVGLFWIVLTVLFEFVFGYLVDRQPLEKLLADYDLSKGRVWSLFLLTEFFTPWIVKLIKERV